VVAQKSSFDQLSKDFANKSLRKGKTIEAEVSFEIIYNVSLRFY